MRSSQYARLVDRRALGARVGREAEHAEQRVAGGEHQRVVLRDQQVFQHGHAGKQADVLEGAGDARLLRDQIVRHALEQEERAVAARRCCACRCRSASRVASQSGGVAVAQRDAALARLVEAGDAVEHGGLAGAVRADQRGDVAAAAPSKDRSSTATRPPKRMVRCSTRSRMSAVARHQPWPSLTRSAAMRLALLQEHRRLARRDQPARPPDHDQHHGEAEQQHAVLRRIEGRRRRSA